MKEKSYLTYIYITAKRNSMILLSNLNFKDWFNKPFYEFMFMTCIFSISYLILFAPVFNIFVIFICFCVLKLAFWMCLAQNCKNWVLNLEQERNCIWGNIGFCIMLKKISYRDIFLKLRYVHTVYQRVKMTSSKVDNAKNKFEQCQLMSLISTLLESKF